MKALQGAEPWLRLRIGVYRVLYRALTPQELATLLSEKDRPSEGYLVERLIHRRDLDIAVDTL